MIFSLVIFFSSLLLYFVAPANYELSFCQIELLIFLVSAMFLIRRTLIDGNYFNFHFFFSVSFFFVNFAYPNFIYPLNPEYFWIFTYNFNHDIIPKALSLSQLAFSSYIIGVIGYDKIKKNKRSASTSSDAIISEQMVRFIKIIFKIMTVLFCSLVVVSGLSLGYSDIVEVINDQLVTSYIIILAIYLLVNNTFHKDNIKGNIKEFFNVNRTILGSALIIIILSFWYGDRGPVLQVTFILFSIFTTQVRRLRLRLLLPIIALGFILMTFVSSTRTGVNNLRTGSISDVVSEGIYKFTTFDTIWDYSMDLIIAARSAYVSLEIVEEKGYLYGKSYFPILFSPIPGLPTLLTEFIIGKSPSELSTAQIITNREGIIYGGLGTNAVGDMYMNLGILGTIVSFILFGITIRWLEFLTTIYMHLAFLLTMALAIYFPRASLFENFPTVIRGIIILFVLLNIFKSKNGIREQTLKT